MIINEYYSTDSRMFGDNQENILESNYPIKIQVKRTALEQQELDLFYQEFEDLDINDESPTDTTHVDKHYSLEQMTFIYVISNDVYSEKNMFKIGKHKGTKKMLIKRYKTYLIDPKVYFFFPSGTVSQDECILLDRFSKFRVGTSEFVKMPLDNLLDSIYCYFKTKYYRDPAVQIVYHKCLYEQKLFDFFEKNIHGKKCMFYPYFDFRNSENCLRRMDFVVDKNIIYQLDIGGVQDKMDIWLNGNMIDFMRCFFLEFERLNYVLYLDKFLEGGWNDFFVECMKRFYGYSSFKILNRREFLLKESFPERLLLIKKSEEPLDIVLEKLKWVNSCVIIEDKNIYSVENNHIICNQTKIEDLFFYLFYILY